MDAKLAQSGKSLNITGVTKENIIEGLDIFYETFPFGELTPSDINGELLAQENRTVGAYEFDRHSCSSGKRSWGTSFYYKVRQKSPSTIDEMGKAMGDLDMENTGIWSYSRLQNEHRDGILRVDVSDGGRTTVHFERMGFEGHPLGHGVAYDHAKKLANYIADEKNAVPSLNVVRFNGDWRGMGQSPSWDGRMKSIEQKLRSEISPHSGTPLFVGKRKPEKAGERYIDTLFCHNYGHFGGGMYWAGFDDVTNLSGHLFNNARGIVGGRFPFSRRNPLDLVSVVVHPDTESSIIDAIKEAFGKDREINEKVLDSF